MRGKLEENCKSKLNGMEKYITTEFELLNLMAAFLMGENVFVNRGPIDLVALEI